MNDTLDEIFEDSGDEEESQDIVNQVLDEIGIEITGKVRIMGCPFLKFYLNLFQIIQSVCFLIKKMLCVHNQPQTCLKQLIQKI